jgi:hypothetical protein
MNNSRQMQEFQNFGGSIMFTNSATAGDLTSRWDFLGRQASPGTGVRAESFSPGAFFPFSRAAKDQPIGGKPKKERER